MPRIKNKQIIVTSNFDMNTHKIINVVDPQNPQDVATKKYVDDNREGLIVKDACRAKTNGLIELLDYSYDSGNDKWIGIATSPNPIFDGVTLLDQERVLFTDADVLDKPGNGLWLYDAGVDEFIRPLDFDGNPNGEVKGGDFTFIQEGTLFSDSGWVLTTNGTIVLGTTSLDWAQFSGAGQVIAGDGLDKDGNILDVIPGFGMTIDNDSVTILPDGDSVSVSASGLKASTLYRQMNENINTAFTISIDNEPTGITLAFTPAGDSDIEVYINGISYSISYTSISESVFYFSADSGATVLSRASLVAGSELIFNYSIAQFNLGLTDVISLTYSTIK